MTESEVTERGSFNIGQAAVRSGVSAIVKTPVERPEAVSC
jgi:hypothetical protein